MCKNRRHGHTGRGVGVLTAPCDQDTIELSIKISLGKKTKISPFSATHTYIKLTLVSFFSSFFFSPFPKNHTLFAKKKSLQNWQRCRLVDFPGSAQIDASCCSHWAGRSSQLGAIQPFRFSRLLCFFHLKTSSQVCNSVNREKQWQPFPYLQS